MTVAMIQARMGSSRLPGKVLLDAAGKPFLRHMVERVTHARTIHSIVIVTSTLAQDDPIADLAKLIGVEVFRGSETDVLDRYYRAAVEVGADRIVRLTADCPLIDPSIVDQIVNLSLETDYALVTNRHPLTFPDGMDVDSIPFSWLEYASRRASTPHQREHVIPFFWQAGLPVYNVECAPNLFRTYRWTVDYPEDAILVKKIFEGLYSDDNPVFSMEDILRFLEQNPGLNSINAMHLPS